MSTLTPPENIGVIITNSTIRKAIYGGYVIVLLVAGAITVAYGSLKTADPAWLTAGTQVLAYLGIPVGSLAVANAPVKSPAPIAVIPAPVAVAPVAVAPVAVPVS